MTKQFIFQFPLSDVSKMPAKFFGNLTVNANATIGREDKVVETIVTGVSYLQPGTKVSISILSLISFLKPELVKEIEAATLSHAKDKYELITA